jgi:hypothetical protein
MGFEILQAFEEITNSPENVRELPALFRVRPTTANTSAVSGCMT